MPSSRSCLLALATVMLPLASSPAQVLTPYDLFVFHNFDHTQTETNGREAIGGNATLTNWRVGGSLPSDYSDYSLVVGGNVTSNSGSVAAGRTYIGGTLDSTLTGFPLAYPPEIGGPSPVDFASDITRLTDISNNYAAMNTTGATVLNGNQLQFIGGGPLNIFSVSIAMLQSGTGAYEFVTPNGATDIVNVLGSSSSSAFNNTGFFFDCTNTSGIGACQGGTNANTPAAAALTLWNFNTQDQLLLGGPVHGSILAPNADVTFGYGDVVGTVVVGSATSNAEYYGNEDFVGELPTSSTPEPATFGLVALGLIGLAADTRRRRA